MRDILNSYSASDLKKEISKYNKKVAIRGYSKMTKSELVNAMMKHQDTFNYLKKKEKAPKPAPKPAPAKPAPKKEESKPAPKTKPAKKPKAPKKDIQEFNYLVSGNPKSREMYGDLLNKIAKIEKKNESLIDKNRDFMDKKSEEVFQRKPKGSYRGLDLVRRLEMINETNLTRELDLELTKDRALNPKFEQKNKKLLNEKLERLNQLNKRINNEIEKLKKV
jgi:hypothetical protein